MVGGQAREKRACVQTTASGSELFVRVADVDHDFATQKMKLLAFGSWNQYGAPTQHPQPIRTELIEGPEGFL